MPWFKGRSEFWLMASAHALVHLFPSTLAPLLPLIRDEFALSYTLIGVVGFLPSLGCVLAVVPAGMLADRVNRVGIIAVALLAAGTGAAVMLSVSGIAQMVLVLLIFSATIGTFHPSAYSYLSAWGSGARGRLVGSFETTGSVGMLVAPVVAGWTAGVLGWRGVYGLWAAPSLIVAAGFFWLWWSDRSQDREAHAAAKRPLRIHRTREARPRRIVLLLFTQGLFGFVSAGTVTFLPLLLTDVRGLPLGGAGTGLALFLTGGLAGKVLGGAGSDRWSPRTVMSVGYGVTGALLILVALTGWGQFVVLAVAGTLFYMIAPALFLLTGELRSEYLGMAYGFQLLFMTSFAAIARLSAGLMGDALGITSVFYMLGAIAFLGATLSWWVLRGDF